MVTEVRSYRLQVLGYRVQTGRRCRADRLQVPGRQVSGAGHTGLRSGTQAQRSRVLALQVQGVSRISPGC